MCLTEKCISKNRVLLWIVWFQGHCRNLWRRKCMLKSDFNQRKATMKKIENRELIALAATSVISEVTSNSEDAWDNRLLSIAQSTQQLANVRTDSSTNYYRKLLFSEFNDILIRHGFQSSSSSSFGVLKFSIEVFEFVWVRIEIIWVRLSSKINESSSIEFE